MQISRSKTTATAITLFLMLAIAFSLVALPEATARTPPIEIKSWPYLVPSPNPVGVGQRVIIVMWVDKPLPSSSVTNDIRRHDYTLTITKPDDKLDTYHWDVVQDSTGIQFIVYTPDQAGTYTLKFDYGGQEYTWNGIFQNDTFSSASKTTTLTVQEEQLPEPINSYPLPEEYWTRPIEGQNTDWWSISSNWLSGAYTMDNVQLDGSAPNTPHIMWTKPVQDGGVVGGSSTTALDGDTYYSGMAYNTRTNNPIIMHGRLYYELPLGNSGGGGGWMCVDLRTGEEIWYDPEMGASGTGVPEPDFGYLYDLQYENQHGTIANGLLIAQSGFFTNTWEFIDPLTGRVYDGWSAENIPTAGAGFGQISGPREAVDEHGNLLRYQIDIEDGWLAQWNSSRVVWTTAGFAPAQGGERDASTPDRYDWNVTKDYSNIPASSTIRAAFPGDILLLSDITNAYGGGFTIFGTIEPYTVTAISLEENTMGQVLWTKSYIAPNNLTRQWAEADPVNRVFVMKDVEAMTFTGYSMEDGNLLWGPTHSQPDYDYFNLQSFAAYGRLYSSGYGGIVFCYSMTNGSLLWAYGGNNGEGNSTFAGLITAWGNYPQFIMGIADGKIYTATYEHSPNSPHYKDMTIRCINAYSGEEIWKVLGAGSAFEMGSKAFAIASGYAVWLNAYDMQLYCAGRGPSATTVTVSPKVSVHGETVLVEGTVIDIAAGTNQNEQVARFPYGVPAVSDESMGDWMAYVYMQKPKPTDTAGVDVTISVFDPNENLYDIGTVTTDSSGKFSYMWEPLVPGKYTVIATFEGSEGYWPSSAETAVGVKEAPAASPEPTPMPASVADQYFLPMSIGTIVAIIAVLALLVILLRKQ